MRISNISALSASDAVSQNGSAIPSEQLVSASFQSVFGDTDAAGTVKIQASNDINTTSYNPNFVPTNWSDIPNATATVTAGVAPIITISNVVYQYMRVVFTQTTPGATTINVKMNAFGV